MGAEVIGSAAFEVRAIDKTKEDMGALQRDLEARLRAIERRYGVAGTSAARGFNVGQKQIVEESKRVESELKGSSDRIAASLRRVAGIIAAGFSAREVSQMADTYKRFSNQLRVAGVEGAALGQVQDALYASAQRNGVQLESLSTLYGRAAQAASSLGASQEDLLKFTDGVTDALRIQGGDPAAASGALLQLSQALQSGIVRAEEFNSVNEGAFPILQTVAAGSEKYAGSVGKLRAAVVDGKVTSEEFFRAFLNGSQMLEERASKAALTTAQGFTALQNALTVYIGESDQALGASALLGSAIGKMADNIDVLIPALAVVATGLGVGMVTRAIASQVAINGVTGSLVAMRGAALAAFGGPVGLAITAITVALGAFAIEGANAAAAARRLEGAMETASQAVAKADAYAGNAASNVKDLGGEATTAGGKVKAFAGEVGAAAEKLWELARAKKAAALAEIAGERTALSTSLAADIARTPEERRKNPFGRRATRKDEWNAGVNFITGEVANWWTRGQSDQERSERVASGWSRLGELDAAERRLQNLKLEDFVDEVRADGANRDVATPKPDKGTDGQSAEDLAKERLERERRAADGQAAADAQVLRARLSLATGTEERRDLELQLLDAEQASMKRERERAVADKALTQAEADVLGATQDRVIGLQKQAVNRAASLDAEERRVRAEEQLANLTVDLLAMQSGVAKTAAERRALELQLLEITQEMARKQLERAIADGHVDDPAGARRLLANLHSAQTAAARDATAGPLEKWMAQGPQTAAQMNEAFERVAVDGLDALNAGLVDAMTGARDLADVFSSVAKSIISDLASIAIRRNITEPLAAALFGSGGGISSGGGAKAAAQAAKGLAGGGGDWMSKLFAIGKGFFGFAEGRIGGDGKISGPGGPRDDLILAMLGQTPIRVSPDESIINAKATKRYWPWLKAMNDGSFEQKFRQDLDGFANGLVAGTCEMPGRKEMCWLEATQ